MPVDNLQNDQLPREETLVRLLELGARYGLTTAVELGARTEAQRHLLEHGHVLAFGCCRQPG